MGEAVFGWFKKRNDDDQGPLLVGSDDYREFRKLCADPAVLAAFADVANGARQVPLRVTDQVRRLVSLADVLIPLAEVSLLVLVRCAQSGDWRVLEEGLARASKKHAAGVADKRPGLELLRDWAIKNNLPELKPMETPAYKMTGFPRDLGQIATLRQLHLTDADLTELPEELGFLEGLSAICVDNNKLSALPQSIFKLPLLQRLDAEGNAIASIPDAVKLAKNLVQIDLDGNNVTSVSPHIASCRALKRLSLRDQQHGIDLLAANTPLSDDAVDALVRLDANGVKVST